MDASVTISVTVHDKERLYKSALAHAMDEDGLGQEDADALLKPDGEISVSDCLIMLFDPGTSPDGCQIEDSAAEVF